MLTPFLNIIDKIDRYRATGNTIKKLKNQTDKGGSLYSGFP